MQFVGHLYSILNQKKFKYKIEDVSYKLLQGYKNVTS